MLNSKNKAYPVRWKTCNCPEVLVNGRKFYLGDGIVRTLLESFNPKWESVPKSPDEDCNHWQSGYATPQVHQDNSKDKL